VTVIVETTNLLWLPKEDTEGGKTTEDVQEQHREVVRPGLGVGLLPEISGGE
jgi:hypothetical protein